MQSNRESQDLRDLAELWISREVARARTSALGHKNIVKIIFRHRKRKYARARWSQVAHYAGQH